MTRRAILLTWFLILAFCAACWFGVYLGSRAALGAGTRCESAACWKRAATWEKQQRRMLEKRLAIKLRPDVELAYRLAIGLYHVDLRKLGYCESRNDPQNRTGRYVGITQQGPDFQGRNRDVYRLVPVTNAVANVLVAARWIARHGDGEWQCSLSGHVRHGGAYS